MLFLKADLAWRLGLLNIWRVLWYRMRLKAGLHPVQRVHRSLNGSSFFRVPETISSLTPPTHWNTESLYFGWWKQPIGDGPPDWHTNPFTGERFASADQPWWELDDFDTGVGDIKSVWEASRMDWVLAFAQRAACGNTGELQRLNTWLSDWCQHNPCYRGPNWKCGQEASIRVMHLLLAARFLGQLESPEPALIELVEAHLARIRPTLSYAIAQDNNHGTSEAAALFIGGDWCARQGVKAGKPWSKVGRRWLENRVKRLIEPDGGFSQHSVNYHRLILDTLCLAELWRQWFELPAFSDSFYQRARSATEWLQVMVDPKTGDAPNLGANDGANLLPLTDANYRDFRTSVQLAQTLFSDEQAFQEDESCVMHQHWLDLELSVFTGATDDGVSTATNQPKTFHSVDYVVFENGAFRVLLRYPHYVFRPGQCDALHIDLSHASDNVLRDDGSYSYNPESQMAGYFGSTAAHNTVQLDDRDSMPRVSRFLRGSWLRTDVLEGPEEKDGILWLSAGYRDWLGAEHRRELSVSSEKVRVIDDVTGFQNRAILRWRLAPGKWRLEGDCAIGELTGSHESAVCRQHVLAISSSVQLTAVRLTIGWESRYYLKKEKCVVVEAEIRTPGQFRTEYQVI